MLSATVPRQRSQRRLRLLSAQLRSRRFPRHPGDQRGPYPSPQPQGRCSGSCRRPDEKLCYRSDRPKHISVPRARPAIPRCSRRPGSAVCLHQLLCKRHPGGLPTPAPQARRPSAGPRSPLSLPHGDRGNACEERRSISQVAERCFMSGGASHKWRSIWPAMEHVASNGVLSHECWSISQVVEHCFTSGAALAHKRWSTL